MTSQKQIRHPLADLTTVTNLETLLEMQKAVIDIHVEDSLRKYILKIVTITRGDERLMLGVSPRGSLALYKGAQAMAGLRGRDYAVPEDIKEIAVPVLRQRILVKSEYSARGLNAEKVIDETLEKVDVPGLKEAV